MKDCPFYRETKGLSQEIERQLRRLRKNLRFCRTCPEAEECPAYQSLHTVISQAADDILAELEGNP